MNPRLTYPIRYCTGGCAQGGHHAHIYTVDPVDGELSGPRLCPGNCGEARETLDDEGEPTGYGFLPQSEAP